MADDVTADDVTAPAVGPAVGPVAGLTPAPAPVPVVREHTAAEVAAARERLRTFRAESTLARVAEWLGLPAASLAPYVTPDGVADGAVAGSSDGVPVASVPASVPASVGSELPDDPGLADLALLARVREAWRASLAWSAVARGTFDAESGPGSGVAGSGVAGADDFGGRCASASPWLAADAAGAAVAHGLVRWASLRAAARLRMDGVTVPSAPAPLDAAGPDGSDARDASWDWTYDVLTVLAALSSPGAGARARALVQGLGPDALAVPPPGWTGAGPQAVAGGGAGADPFVDPHAWMGLSWPETGLPVLHGVGAVDGVVDGAVDGSASGSASGSGDDAGVDPVPDGLAEALGRLAVRAGFDDLLALREAAAELAVLQSDQGRVLGRRALARWAPSWAVAPTRLVGLGLGFHPPGARPDGLAGPRWEAESYEVGLPGLPADARFDAVVLAPGARDVAAVSRGSAVLGGASGGDSDASAAALDWAGRWRAAAAADAPALRAAAPSGSGAEGVDVPWRAAAALVPWDAFWDPARGAWGVVWTPGAPVADWTSSEQLVRAAGSTVAALLGDAWCRAAGLSPDGRGAVAAGVGAILVVPPGREPLGWAQDGSPGPGWAGWAGVRIWPASATVRVSVARVAGWFGVDAFADPGFMALAGEEGAGA